MYISPSGQVIGAMPPVMPVGRLSLITTEALSDR